MMENIIRVYGLLYGGLTGDTVEEEQEIIDMVERNFEDDLEDADQDTSSPLAQAQEQVRHLNVQGYIMYGWKIWQFTSTNLIQNTKLNFPAIQYTVV